jgi:4-diphosphocytidyl-2-C-methyl-D-erythritol kinase
MLVERQANTVTVQAPAKVNLFLETLHKRPDGYHEIVTCMVAVSLFDTLELKEDASGAIHLTCDEAALPVGPTNLVWRAAELLRQRTDCQGGVRMHLQKRIPLASGLAGGSSDAAATLAGLNQLWNLGIADQELATLAAELGTDVPFFFSTPAAWCTGRGELVTPFTLPVMLHLVLACPPTGLSTAEVYSGVTIPEKPESPEPLRQALERGDVEAIGAVLHNRLQAAAEMKSPEVRALRQLFATLGPAGHQMSGSGSTYFALCRSQPEAEALARQVLQQVRSPQGLRVFVVRSLSGQETGISHPDS